MNCTTNKRFRNKINTSPQYTQIAQMVGGFELDAFPPLSKLEERMLLRSFMKNKLSEAELTIQVTLLSIPKYDC